MGAADLTRADPLPRIISWLGSHPAVGDALGGAGRVGASNVPPYPRLRVVDPPGDDRELRWLLSPLVQIEAYGDLDGTTPKADLRRALYAALGALAELPEQPVPPEGPVITHVSAFQGGGWVPEASGQGRYIAVVRVWVHPLPEA